MLGTQTLLSMRQFIEDAEKENEKEKGGHDTELEAMDSSASAQKVGAQQEAIKALRMLFEDFEDQFKCQNEVKDESSSESEPSEAMQGADPVTQLSSILPLQEDEDTLLPNKEPQLYLCDDWIQLVEVVRKPKELTARESKGQCCKELSHCHSYITQCRIRFYS